MLNDELQAAIADARSDIRAYVARHSRSLKALLKLELMTKAQPAAIDYVAMFIAFDLANVDLQDDVVASLAAPIVWEMLCR